MNYSFKGCVLVVALLQLSLTTIGQDWEESIKQLPRMVKGSTHTFEDNSGDIIEIPITRGESSIPKRYSLKEFVPATIQQIGGSCVSFSTVYYAMTTYLRKKDNNKEIKPYNPMDLHSRVHAFLNTCDEIQDGLNPGVALTLLRDFGIQPNENIEFDTSSCEMVYPLEDSPIKLNNWKKLNNSPQNLDKIKFAISQGKPVVSAISTNLSMDLYHKKNWQTFKNISLVFDDVPKEKQTFLLELIKQCHPSTLRGFSNKDIINEIKKTENFDENTEFCWTGKHPLENQEGHAVCIIGYDDNLYGGAFEIVNSWGPNWGNSGYLWIKYSDFYKMYPTFYMIGN